MQLADLLASQGDYEQAAQWCSEVRKTLNEDDLTDAIGVDSLEGFLAAVAGSHAEAERLSTKAITAAETTDFYELRANAYYWHARSLALNGQLAEARAAVAVAVSIYESKGDRPASTSARASTSHSPAERGRRGVPERRSRRAGSGYRGRDAIAAAGGPIHDLQRA